MMWKLVGFLASLGLGLSIVALMGAAVVGIIAYGARYTKQAIKQIQHHD